MTRINTGVEPQELHRRHSELKPCPFCGGAASLIPSADHSTACEIGCRDDTCPAYECVWDVNEASAIAAWNRRASSAPKGGEEALTALLRRTKQTLCVPAAEYVPAMGDAMLLLDKAIQMSYQTDPNWLLSSPTTEGRDMKTATQITGPCSCPEIYTSRNLTAPDCAFHDMAQEIAEALADARCDALEEAAKVATDAIDSMKARHARSPDVDISALLLTADRIYQGIKRLRSLSTG